MVLFGGVWLYRCEALNTETLDKFGRGTPDDWLERKLYSGHRYMGIALMLAIDLIAFGVAGLAVWVVQMLWIPFWAAGVINGVGHYWGYRNFETQDASRNILPWGILIGGEELHNNHHAYGVSARLSNKWWEFDIGWLYIRLLEIFGLAQVRRVSPKTSFVESRNTIDMEMLKAIVANRFHVMKLYGSRVVRPVFRAECRGEVRSERKRLLSLRKLLATEDTALDERRHLELSQGLGMNPTLQTVYEFKLRLKALWEQRSRESGDMLAKLQSWCADAEASGIAALQEFARQLRGYREQFA